MYQRNIERENALTEESRYLRKEYRYVIAASVLDRRPNIGTDEKRVHAKTVGELRFGIPRFSFGMKVDKLDAAELGRSVDHCFDQCRRSRSNAVYENAVTGPYDLYGFCRRDCF